MDLVRFQRFTESYQHFLFGLLVFSHDNNYTYDRFSYEDGGAFINNYGVLEVENMEMENTVAYSVFYNEGSLTIKELALDADHYGNHSEEDFDVDGLHSHTIIDQRGSSLSSVEISDSDFYGANFAIWIRFGVSFSFMLNWCHDAYRKSVSLVFLVFFIFLSLTQRA